MPSSKSKSGSKSRSKPAAQRLSKRSRFYLSLLLIFVLVFTIGYFMDDPANMFGPPDNIPAAQNTFLPSPTGTPKDTPAKTPKPKSSQALPAATSSLPGRTLDTYVLDVGQGDCIFLKSPSGKTMLVDASTSDQYKNIDAFLSSQKVKRLDVVIATHPHADHIGSMQKIVENYEIGTFYMPDAVTTTAVFNNLLDTLEKKKILVEQAVAGPESFIPWDKDVEIRILSPFADTNAEDLNNQSVVCRVRYKNTAVMLTGDAEAAAESRMLKELPASYFSATVLKLGHHGSNTSTSDAFLAAVNPQAAVASLGIGNEYGHPHKEIIAKLKAAKITFYRTDKNKTLHISMNGKAYTITAEK